MNEIKDQALSMKLIDLVKNHPVLWSVSSKPYLDANKKVDAWRDIATDLGKPENAVIKKWQSLCAYFRKENAKIKKSMITGSARSEVYVSKWFAFESMQFVGNTAKARKTQSTQQHSRSQNLQPAPEPIDTDVIMHHQLPTEITEDVMHHQSPPAENNTTLLQPENQNNETVTQNTRKRKTPNNRDEDFSAIFSSIGQSLDTIITNMNNYSSRNVTFGNYVTQTLEGLPKTKQEKLIHKINLCIFEINNENDS
ncbi:uncharacterized protein LOC131291498 [Anopheles ziemanni]|uniref:uncharacterized protein LOC131269840 n=1 Tax=Anopheles coustani TaxID=139045 RepID=UPI002657F8EA|nr:uncharacterized protein LOC131269840 [Anopheles coustani]XP_058176700.1 uncharacterized protein LOC131291498 [Anopheles ziemanni]